MPKHPKSTPAEPGERIKGSSKNKKGSAKGLRGGIVLSESVIRSLKNKVSEHNEASSKRVTLGQLKAVYRRGSGAFSTSHHPKANRHSWSMGRVNSFLRRVKGGKGHSQDDDLIKKAQETYEVPQGVKSAAKRGLELRHTQPKRGKEGLSTAEAGKQGIGSGVARARDLIRGRVSKRTIKRMHAYFSRHQGNYKLDAGKAPREDKGYVAGLLWGGEAGRSFAAKMVKRFKREENGGKKRSSKTSKSMGPFQRDIMTAINEAHPFGYENVANGKLKREKNPKHAPGGGWLPLNDGTQGWMRPSSKGINLVDVWYCQHDEIIDISRAAGLPRRPEYEQPDLCGSLQVAMIESRKHMQYAETNLSAASDERWTVAQTQAILAIARIQKKIAQFHADAFNRMVAEKRAQSLLTLRY